MLMFFTFRALFLSHLLMDLAEILTRGVFWCVDSKYRAGICIFLHLSIQFFRASLLEDALSKALYCSSDWGRYIKKVQKSSLYVCRPSLWEATHKISAKSISKWLRNSARKILGSPAPARHATHRITTKIFLCPICDEDYQSWKFGEEILINGWVDPKGDVPP